MDKNNLPDTVTQGRTRMDLEQGQRQFAALLKLVPRDVCEKIARALFADINRQQADELVMTDESADSLSELSGMTYPWGLRWLGVWLTKLRLRQLRGKKHCDLPPSRKEDDDFIRKEVEIAAGNFTRGWINVLHFACRDTFPNKPIRLSALLLPAEEPNEGFRRHSATWEAYLLNKFELGELKDLRRVLERFAAKVKEQIDSNPDGFVVMEDGSEVLRICCDEHGYYLAPIKS